MTHDTIIIGAGAAGMFCAAHAAHSGNHVLVLDHAKAPGEKIRISGGGKCNFTNVNTQATNFISQNPHFAKSSLKRYTQYDFIDLVKKHKIPFHEKTLGQLFCDTSAKDIIDLLKTQLQSSGAKLQLETTIVAVEQTQQGFSLEVEQNGKRQSHHCRNLVIASGGKSIPKMGATALGYKIAEKFKVPIVETRPALVPLTFPQNILEQTKNLSGVSVEASVNANHTTFEEGLLFTHRGLSGPSVLQISSYWREGQPITINLATKTDLYEQLRTQRKLNGKITLQKALSQHLPKSIVIFFANSIHAKLADTSDRQLMEICRIFTKWKVNPIGTEGYRTAEVTLGGVDTNSLNSKSMEVKSIPGLYFIGEVVDVTGWLGGYNFQWAWSSAWAAGTAIAQKMIEQK